MRRSKRYVEASKIVDKNQTYSITEAIELCKKLSTVKFDSSIEISINLNLDTRKADQQLRGATVLPNGTGKAKKVLVIAKGDALKEAIEAKADYAGEMDMIQKISEEGFMDFDVVIATPDMMGALGKVAKILGPKGLMPNPKTGTVTVDVKKAINDVKKGRVEYRADTFGIIHAMVGKVSFDAKALEENIRYFYDIMVKSKPAVVKGTYVKGVTLATTMGPSVRIDLTSLDK